MYNYGVWSIKIRYTYITDDNTYHNINNFI